MQSVTTDTTTRSRTSGRRASRSRAAGIARGRWLCAGTTRGPEGPLEADRRTERSRSPRMAAVGQAGTKTGPMRRARPRERSQQGPPAHSGLL